jgi:hypothetical protein
LPQATAGNDVFLITVTYNSFTGEGSAEESALAAVKIHSSLVEGSIEFDEAAKTIRFQHKGRVPLPALAKVFANRGFPRVKIQMLNP